MKHTKGMKQTDNDTRIREEVEKTLSSLDAMEKLQAGPHFYAQIEAKLRGAGQQEKAPWLDRLGDFLGINAGTGAAVLRPALLLLLILANIFSAALFLIQPQKSPPHSTNNERETYIAALANDYKVSQNTYDTQVHNVMAQEKE